MDKLPWFERTFQFGLPAGMLPYFIERIGGVIPRLADKVSQASDSTLSECLDGKWSVKQNIGHLMEMDQIAIKRIAEVLAGSEVLSPAILQLQQDYNAMPIGELIAQFNDNRRLNLKTLQSLNSSDLSKSGLHPRLKIKVTPVDLALFNAEHDDHHLLRMSEIINTLKQ